MGEASGNFLPPVKSAHKPDSPQADVRTRAVLGGGRSNKSCGGRAASTSLGVGVEVGNANPVGWEAPPTPSKRELNKVQFRKHNELPFDIQADVLLGEISKRIKLPRRDGYLSFKSTLRSSTSCQLLTYYFWHLYCKRYLSHEKKQTKLFLDMLAEKFVNLFWSLQNSAAKDFFLEYYPYAIAASICLAFHEHFPGSRLEFTEAFRNKIFQETRHVFSGVDSTTELMQQKRELMGLVSESDKAGPGAGRPGEPAEPDPGPAAQDDVWTEEELQAELKKIPGYIERKKQRMKRETFDAMDTSPLVRHYVSAIADAHATKKTLKMKWTLPPIDLHKSFRPKQPRESEYDA
mmetsp:Transcript_35270/g.67421  ORF Transcript_35270/g.67421 Transcript_35270/m.67421 type:complete len:348 (-) Transcript_35270:513-1556(-)